MGKVGGERNFGYGKKMEWAGKSALADRYGDGHYATRAAHVERWGRFVSYAKAEGIKDARAVTRELMNTYGVSAPESASVFQLQSAEHYLLSTRAGENHDK